jgi:hypothetical protein
MWLHFILVLSIFLTSFLFLYVKKTKKSKICFFIIIFTQLYILSAFRSIFVGNDTKSNYEYFLRILSKDIILTEYSERAEYGFFLLNKSLTYISSNPQILFIVSSFIILVLYLRFINLNSNIIWLSVYLLLTTLEFYSTMNILRQSIAIAIILASYEFVKNKEPTKFILTVALAALFHYTALIFLIVYPFRNIKYNKKTVFSLIAGALIIFISYDWIAEVLFNIMPRYANYIYKEKFADIEIGSILKFLVSLSILIFGGIVKVNKDDNPKQRIIISKNKNNYTYGNNILSYICLFGTLISFLSINFSILSRIANYFVIFNIIYVPAIIRKIKDKKKSVTITSTVIILFLIYSFIIIYFRPYWNKVFPYAFFWQE